LAEQQRLDRANWEWVMDDMIDSAATQAARAVT
jgi:hypothetical protein